jgi:hypothetical protein
MFTACLPHHFQNPTRTNISSGLIRNSYLLNKQLIIDNSRLGLANTQDERFTPFLVIKIKGNDCCHLRRLAASQRPLSKGEHSHDRRGTQHAVLYGLCNPRDSDQPWGQFSYYITMSNASIPHVCAPSSKTALNHNWQFSSWRIQADLRLYRQSLFLEYISYFKTILFFDGKCDRVTPDYAVTGLHKAFRIVDGEHLKPRLNVLEPGCRNFGNLGFIRLCESKFSPPGTIVHFLLSELIKPWCSCVKDYVANPDHNRQQYTDTVLGDPIPRTNISFTPAKTCFWVKRMYYSSYNCSPQ